MLDIPDISPTLPRNIEELRGRKDPEAIKAVAKEMESMFAYEMIKVMRESIGSPKGTNGADTYMSMFDMELSKLFAKRGLGLQDTFVKGLNSLSEKEAASQGAQSGHEIKDAGNKVLGDEIKTLLPNSSHTQMSSDYGLRHDPFNGDLKFHNGMDISAPEGTEIHPLKSGTVLFSGEQPGYGNVVVIDHGDGYISKYAHNKTNLVQQGEIVDTGSVIAQVGSTGRSTGPHMHIEVIYKGKPVDPKTLLALR